jgi:hypothetical protein
MFHARLSKNPLGKAPGKVARYTFALLTGQDQSLSTMQAPQVTVA